MWKKQHQKFYKNASAEKIWQKMTDINSWTSWHKGLESCRLKGDFKAGNSFQLTPKGGKTFEIKITQIEEGKSFTDCTTFPGAKMWDTHLLEERDGGVLLSNILVVTGPLRWFWIKLVAKKVADTIEEKFDTLVHLTREENHERN